MGDCKNDGLQETLRAIREADAKGDNRAMYQLIDAALLNYQDCVELWAIASVSLLWRGRREDAQSAFAKAKELAPDSALTWAAEADFNAFYGGFDYAREAAERAIAINNTDPWILQRVIGILAGIGPYERAIEIADHWRELYPDSIDAFSSSYSAFIAADRLKEADAILQEAERRFADSPMIWQKRARTMLRAHRLDDAIKLLRRASEALNGNWMIWAELASSLSIAKHTDEAEVAAKRALDMSGCSTLAMTAMARVCQQRGQTKKAEEWQKRASEAIPGLKATSALNNANAAMVNSDWNKAIAIIDEYLTDMPSLIHRVGLEIKTRALFNLNRIDEAAGIIEEMDHLGNRTLNWYELAGKLRRQQGDLEGAVRLLSEGLDHNPAAGILRAELIQVLHDLGNTEQEEQLVQSTFQNLPHTPDGFIMLSISLDKIGHPQESREVRRIGLKQFPGSEALKMMAAVDMLEIGDTQTAREMARGIKGEMRDVAETLDKAGSFIDRIHQAGEKLRMKKNQKPPTIN